MKNIFIFLPILMCVIAMYNIEKEKKQKEAELLKNLKFELHLRYQTAFPKLRIKHHNKVLQPIKKSAENSSSNS